MQVPVPVLIVRDALKWKGKDGDHMQLLHDVAADFASVCNQLQVRYHVCVLYNY